MSVKELAAAAGISGNTLLSYIDARGYLPNVETAVKIAKTLGVSVEYLVTGKRTVATDKETDDFIQTFVHLTKHDKKLLEKIADSMKEIEED
ncbi:MAG: helix-turn-helix transcriptional regulator [Treponema sp.]|nr:helix-turn-helix transcriptional regulator [Treponema sp.]